MSTQITAGPKIYIGLDIHKSKWAIAIATDICFHRSFSMDSDPNALFKYVEKNFPNHQVFMAYEAGCCGFHTARYFINLAWNVLVVNPADINKNNKDKHFKSDKIDAKKICDELKSNRLKSVNIPTEKEESLQSLLRHRNQITKDLRRIKNRIKSLLLFHGITIPKDYDNPNWSKAFIKWLKELSFEHLPLKYALEGKVREFEFIKKEYLEIANQLRAYCRKEHKEDYYLFKSIPGIGGYLAATILAECGDLRRFKNHRQFASFVGFIPSMNESNDNGKTRGINPRCRPILRAYLIESAWVAMRMDPDLQNYYRTHTGKNVKGIAVKIAHKLCNRILAVIKKNEPYQTNYSTQINSKECVEN